MVSQIKGKQTDFNEKVNHKNNLGQSNPELKDKTNQNKKKHNCGCQQSHNYQLLQQQQSSSQLKSTKPFIGTYHQAPQWMRYQELTIGYRINFNSFKLIIKSLFIVHNQTTNVWTHLLGSALLLFIAIITCSDFISMFQLGKQHSHLQLYKDVHPLGSGQSFVENVTGKCIDEQCVDQQNQKQQFLYKFSQHDKLAYKMCQKQPNRHECYIRKSHQTKLRNWLQFNLGVSFDQIQKMKLIVQNKMVPQFVHQIEGTFYHNHHLLKKYLQGYLHLVQKDNYIGIQDKLQNSQQPLQQTTNKQDTLARWPLIFYLICNSVCLLCSVTYHLFYPLSQRAHSLCVCTDFAGISVLFGGSAIPCIYYGMYCYFQVGEIYLTGIICASLLVFGLSFTNKFQDRKSSTFRVAIYFVFACFMVTPLFHMSINQLIFNNYNDSYSFVSSLQWYVLGLLFFGVGGFFYASQQLIFLIFFNRVPNRFSQTGRYDIFGHSHHYWHVFVVLAIVTIYVGCLENYFTRKESTCGIVVE